MPSAELMTVLTSSRIGHDRASMLLFFQNWQNEQKMAILAEGAEHGRPGSMNEKGVFSKMTHPPKWVPS